MEGREANGGEAIGRVPGSGDPRRLRMGRKQNCDEWTPEGGTGDSLRETAETEREDEARRIGGEAEV
ncbi:actin binding protein [Aspergillus luchuensis]|uniref:Actin binding protein n=1 Tax=Aspergillus kawachii TaxID=1069201 RepID=A0A146FV89_ASPKA|nr:actin binding protein [Aspergillus luchuensis]